MDLKGKRERERETEEIDLKGRRERERNGRNT